MSGTDAAGGGSAAKDRGKARVVAPDRAQPAWDMVDPEKWLPADHSARLVWSFVETLDLTALYDKVAAREGEPGRPAADPAVLLALWLLATIDGVGSARALARMTRYDLAYQWLCWGVPINYHGLADFRVAHADILDDLLTRTLAALMAEGLVDVEEIIVDGTKVKASAGKSSFKRRQRLDEAEAAAKTRVAALKAEVASDPAASDKRRQAARERAAREAEEKVAKAKAALAAIEAERATRAEKSPKEMAKRKAPRASTTDPEARRMRFADGAVRAGYNVQFAVTDRGFVTALEATDRRNDSGLARPMLEQVEQRLGCKVKRLLADTGYAAVDDIAALGTRPEPVEVLMPPPPEKEGSKPESRRRLERARAKEPEVIKAWRARMADTATGAIMKRRGRIELVNAQTKNRGLGRLLVRGLAKVKAVVLWHVLAHNFTTAIRLRAAKVAATGAGAPA